mmetsp:Transcript_69355/g.137089  ORF Transcript_69355/g.137089 Transcript_69355/m.137089 type:complete len:241 (-) Transcript_69355:42-764(-)
MPPTSMKVTCCNASSQNMLDGWRSPCWVLAYLAWNSAVATPTLRMTPQISSCWPAYHLLQMNSAKRTPGALRITMRSCVLPDGPAQPSVLRGNARSASAIMPGCSEARRSRFSASVGRAATSLLPRTSFKIHSWLWPSSPGASFSVQTPSLRPPWKPGSFSKVAPSPTPSFSISCSQISGCCGSKTTPSASSTLPAFRVTVLAVAAVAPEPTKLMSSTMLTHAPLVAPGLASTATGGFSK